MAQGLKANFKDDDDEDAEIVWALKGSPRCYS